MVLADSHEISRVPRYSGTTPTPHNTSPSTRLSRSTVRLPRLFNSQQLVARSPGRRIQHGPTTPNTQRPPPLTRIWFSLLRFRSPLLTEYLLLRVLRCFTSPRNPPTNYLLHWRVTTHNHGRVSPFGHPRINAHQATPRGLTQPITSFIGLAYPGIHHAPKKQKTQTFFTHRQQKIPRTKPQKRKNKQQQHNYRCYFYRIRVHYTVLTQHTTPHTTPNKRPCLPGVIHRTTLVLL